MNLAHQLVRHLISPVAVSLAMFYAFCICGWLLEKALALDRDTSHRGALFNCAYMIFFAAVNVTGGVWFARRLSVLVIHAPFHGFLTTAIEHCGVLPASVMIGIAVAVLNDFFSYWFHRLQHSSRWLWALHEFHHSEEHVNVTTAGRHHWMEIPLTALFIAAPVEFLFGPSLTAAGLMILVWQAPGYFTHLNAHIRFGALGRVFSCPQTHLIHHSVEDRHIDKNFAAWFTLWDSLFGTYYHPARDEWPQSGLASGKHVRSLPYALVMPFFTWRDMLFGKPQGEGTGHN